MEGRQATSNQPAGADIRLELAAVSASQLAVGATFRPKPGAKRPQAFVALYENGLVTEVKAGENRGATLRHDHVVRQWIGPLDPGRYVLFCNMYGHYLGGMHAVLVVR